MRALILQFDVTDPPDRLGEHLTAHHVAWDVVKLFQPHARPTLDGYDMLIALGGAMGAYEGDRYPFLDEAVGLIGLAVRRDLPYLGICLGGQLLARALGAEVTRAPASEIGLIEITLRPEARDDPLLEGLGPVMETVQFHQDTFSMPEGSTLLASSTLCTTQIVRCAPRAYALQFHPEASAATFASWIDHYLRHFDDSSQVAQGYARSDEVRRHDAIIRAHATRLFDNFLRLAVPAHAAR